MFGTVTHAIFPVAPQRDADSDVLAVTGMDTLELVSRLQRSDLDQATLEGLRIMANRLCSEYAFMPVVRRRLHDDQLNPVSAQPGRQVQDLAGPRGPLLDPRGAPAAVTSRRQP